MQRNGRGRPPLGARALLASAALFVACGASRASLRARQLAVEPDVSKALPAMGLNVSKALPAVGLVANDGRQPAYGAPYGAPEGLQNAPPAVVPGAQAAGAWVKPKLFFLFLVYVKISHESIWDRFFAAAVQGIDYRALVHCKSEASCRSNIKSQHRYEIISSVDTKYCFDLVSGMNALLRAALIHGGPGNLNDKFIFVSDSTLPVKPFPFLQRRLTVEAGPVSDFCIFPRGEWAEVTESYLGQAGSIPPVTHAAVKHHQWIILSRQHAELSIARATEKQDLMTTFQLNMGFRNTGCLDEFWYFATLFKSLNLSGYPSTLHMQGFAGSPLNTASLEVQGQCDTFVHWLPRASGTSNNITRLAAALTVDPGTEMTPVSEKRPATLRRLSKTALSTLRTSDFLFARKIDEACTFSGCDSLEEAFSSLVFSTPPRPLPKAAPTWGGQGMWMDNRQLPVTITSLDGTLRVTGSDSSMEAKGSYCDMKIEVVFGNSFRASASLSSDSQRLHWDNGVVWHRAYSFVHKNKTAT